MMTVRHALNALQVLGTDRDGQIQKSQAHMVARHF